MRRLRIALMACLLAGCSSEAREELVPLDDVPAIVLDAAREKLPDVEFKRALKRPDDCYEVRGNDKTGKVRTINLTDSGEVLADRVSGDTRESWGDLNPTTAAGSPAHRGT